MEKDARAVAVTTLSRVMRPLLVLLLALLAAHAVGAVTAMQAMIAYPFGIDYGEGIVWQQAALIPGPYMYASAPAAPLAGLPFPALPYLVFHYPPVYYLLVHALAPWAPDLLAAGRIVTAVCTMLLPMLVVLLVLMASPPGRPVLRVGLALAAGLLLFDLPAVRSWGVIMRVDTPGYVLALAGLAVAARADGRFPGTVLALLLCTAAVFTKQTLLPAGAAVMLIGLVRRPRATLAAGVVAGAAGLAAVGVLQAATGGGFLANILGNNINRVAWAQGVHVLRMESVSMPQLGVVALASAWFVAVLALRLGRRPLHALRAADPLTARRVLLAAYALLCLASLATIFKVGSNYNYLIEAFAAGSVLLGLALIDLTNKPAPLAHLCVIWALMLVGAGFVRTPIGGVPTRLDPSTPAYAAIKTDLVARIAAEPRPVVSDEMTLLLRAGKSVSYEPAIVTELASLGRWDEAPLVATMRAAGFAFIVTADGGTGPTERRTPAVNAAMQAAYPRISQLAPRLWLREPP